MLCALLLVIGCALVSEYDPISYKSATYLKVEALELMEKGTDPPGPHSAAIESLRTKLRQAVEYEKWKGDQNRRSREQWEILSDPTQGLLGEFLAKWQAEKNGLDPVYVNGTKTNVAGVFDDIIRLEINKLKN